MKTKIFALTGIRSEYDLLYPLLLQLEQADDFELGVIVSGAHLSPLHNYSIHQVEQDGFCIVEKIDNLLYSDRLSAKAKSSAILMQSLTQVLDREQPDYFIVIGDREESIIGALTAGYMNIPVIHLAGGDHTNPLGGDIDEQVRHATSKLAHVHFTMRQEHSERLIKLGEEPWRIHTVGSGGVDRIRMVPNMSRNELENKLGYRINEKYAIVIYHPLSSQIGDGEKELELILQSLVNQNLKIFIGYPNSDPGFEGIIKVIQKFENDGLAISYNNLGRDLFINLLKHASVLVGNSSLGLHEAPFLSLPVINVGERQKGRLAGKNVQFVDASRDDIENALYKVLYDIVYKEEIQNDRNIYGDGYMAERCVSIIRKFPTKEKLLAKKLTY